MYHFSSFTTHTYTSKNTRRKKRNNNKQQDMIMSLYHKKIHKKIRLFIIDTRCLAYVREMINE